MSTDLANFKSWYAEVLAGLYGNRNAGLAIFMLSLPLAERYLRQKCGLGPETDFDDRCIQELRVMFPVLPDAQTARQFWTVYRNGFLHQATLSRHTRKGTALPVGWLTHDIALPVKVEADGSFWVNPVLFSQQIVREIESNFAIFAGAGTTAPPLPTTVTHVAAPSGLNVPPVNISTRGGT